VLVTWTYCAETSKPIKMPLEREGLTCEPKEACIRWGQDQMNPFLAVTGDKMAIWMYE